ncbi:MAG TPA: hypothetical protein PKD64_16450 [Pirellulaceae bacterium]|nr:hypothetical protein [Pirellulaceae bacterium]
MFDKLLRELKKLERGVLVPIQISVDDNGQLDRQCPSRKCRATFKISLDDWRDKVRDDVVFCPFCRHEAPSTEWNTNSQENYIKRAGMAHLKKIVKKAMVEDARSFNSRQPRGGLISISMQVKPESAVILIPPKAAEEMRQEFICEECGCRYSSLGASFFCPSCGSNNARSTFAAAVEGVRTTIAHLPNIRRTVEEAAGKDAAADTCRQLLENGLVKLVASFQRFAEAMFEVAPKTTSVKVRTNLFQNLAESTVVWKAAIGIGYEDVLDPREMEQLNLFFQQRHKLNHCEGVIDQAYIDKSGDRTYRIGQRLVIQEPAVMRLAELVERLANGLTSHIASLGQP